MSDLYLFVDPRYKLGLNDDSGEVVFMVSMLELLFQAPACLAAYYAYRRGKAWAPLAQFVASLLHVVGVFFMYLPELLRGFPHLDADTNWTFSFQLWCSVSASNSAPTNARLTQVCLFVVSVCVCMCVVQLHCVLLVCLLCAWPTVDCCATMVG